MFYKEIEFQNTQTGKIPRDWQDATLSDLSEHITKGTTPTTYGFSYESSGVNFIKVESIDENGKFISENVNHIRKQANDALSRSMLKEKDILFSIAGALGRVALVSDKILPANTNQALSIIRIREKEKVLPEYLKYFLTGPNIQEFIKSIAIQSQQANLNLEQVRKFRVGLPSVSEQKEIVGILGVVDSALELADRLIEKTERLKRGLMQQLLTRGIGHTETKQTPIGKLPESWEVSKLSEVARVNVGYVGSISQFYTDSEKGVPLLSTTNVTEKGLRLDELKFVTPEFHERNKKSQVSPGTVLVARHGLSGTAALIPESLKKANCLNVVVVHPSSNLNPKFMEYIFNFKPFRERLLGWKTGSVQGVVNTKILEKTLVPVPPLDEQKKIIEILSAADAKLDIEERGKVKVETVKQGLMDLLLTGKVRIKVD